MKKFVTLSFITLGLVAATLVSAQTPATPATFVRGNMNIRFGENTDHYDLDFNVCNSCRFHGGIDARHYVAPVGTIWPTPEIPLGITYTLDCDIMNPKNLSQTKNVGQVTGMVKVPGTGIYDYEHGSLECSVIPMGNAAGMDSFFRGTASGKPLNRPVTWKWQDMSADMVNISRIINGRVSTVTLKKYDQMKFDNCRLCAGPMASYQPVIVNGTMYYDYEKRTWFLKEMTVQYTVGQSLILDRLSGNIRWMPDANRAQNGLGEYDFDVKVNEPAPSEDQVFQTQPTDESAFFQSDDTVPGVSGTWKYKDTITPNTITKDNPDGDVTLSAVQIDMEGNKLTKQQMMVLFKLLVLQMIVPMNNG